VAVPIWLWLWLPPLLLLGEQGAFGWTFYLFDYIYSESGAVELATPLASGAGAVFGIAALRHRKRLPTGWLRGWVALCSGGCVFFTGEELSWGQHLFGWATPESLLAINDQGETNLHNISSWFDQKPRMLLDLFVLYGGIIRVLLHRGDVRKGDWRAWFWPTYICLPSAGLAMLVQVPALLQSRLGMDLSATIHWSNWPELQELYLAIFLLVYLWEVWYRLGNVLSREREVEEAKAA